MKRTPESVVGETLEEQAGHWIVRQHSGRWTDEEQRRFEQWLNTSAAHQDAYQRVEVLWQGLDRFQSTSFPVLEGLTHAPVSQAHRWSHAAKPAAFALAVLVFASMSPWSPWPTETLYRTARGERQIVALADGSQIHLNTDTEISAQLTSARRTVRLLRGEALFTVIHDATRPFEVIAGMGTIRDLGTRFNVREDGDRIAVAVLDGEVSIHARAAESTRLSQGQGASYSDAGVVSVLERPDLAALTAWENGKLIFELTPLRAVAAELARYHAVEFIFDDPRIENLQVSGTFRAKDLRLLLSTLEAIYPIKTFVSQGHSVHFVPAVRR